MTALRSGPFADFIRPALVHPALWRLVAGVVLIVAVYLLLNGLAFLGFAAFAGRDAAGTLAAKLMVASTPGSALLVLATFGPLLAGTALAVRLLHRRGPLTLLGPPRRAVAQTFGAAGVGLAAFAVGLALWALRHDSVANLPAGIWLLLLPLALAAIALQTLAEEALFRGYLMQQLAARVPQKIFWMGLPAALFGILHYDPSRTGDAAAFTALAAFGFGLLAADLTVRSGTLGPAWGLHFANNAVALAGLGTGGSLTGLALRVTPYDMSRFQDAPLLMLAELVPVLLAWAVLRWRLRS